jgi:hypothetical protein
MHLAIGVIELRLALIDIRPTPDSFMTSDLTPATLMATSNSPTFGQSNSPRQDG